MCGGPGARGRRCLCWLVMDRVGLNPTRPKLALWSFSTSFSVAKTPFKMLVTSIAVQGRGDTVGLKHLHVHLPSLCAPSLGGKWEPVPAHSLPLSHCLGPLGFLVPQALLQTLSSVGAIGGHHSLAGWSFFFIWVFVVGGNHFQWWEYPCDCEMGSVQGLWNTLANSWFLIFFLLLSLIYSWSALAVSPVCLRDVDPNCSLHVAV